MKKLQIVMPMGGIGKRFKDAGVTTFKPLIVHNALPLYQHALFSLGPLFDQSVVHFIFNEDNLDCFLSQANLEDLGVDYCITTFHKSTNGALDTCQLTEKRIKQDWPLLVLDCDLRFKNQRYLRDISRDLDRSGDLNEGKLLTFPASASRFSYVAVDESGFVTDIAEKKAISQNAVMGTYYFSEARLFFENLANVFSKDEHAHNGEYYVSSLVYELVQQGIPIKTYPLPKGSFQSLGTPHELKQARPSL